MKTYNFKSWTHKYIPLIKASSLYKAYLIALRWADDAVYTGELPDERYIIQHMYYQDRFIISTQTER